MDFVTTKWFAEETPVNAVKASLTLGAGADGVITITADSYGTEGNDYTVEVVVAEGANAAMKAVLTDKAIVITLGTGGVAGTVADAKNTAKLIAPAVAALAGVTATYSGTGATSLTKAVAKDNLAGGLYATEVPQATMICIGENIYFTPVPVGHIGTSWRKIALVAL
jgi:hypothetical protein